MYTLWIGFNGRLDTRVECNSLQDACRIWDKHADDESVCLSARPLSFSAFPYSGPKGGVTNIN